MKNCYLFGLQRSGTNFIQNLLSQNEVNLLNWKPDTAIWKHTYNKKTPTNDPIAYVIKHPDKWLESITNHPIDVHLLPQKDMKKLWQEHADFWIPKATYVFKYEDVLRDPEAFFGPVKLPTILEMNNTFSEERKKRALEGLTPHKFYDRLNTSSLTQVT